VSRTKIANVIVIAILIMTSLIVIFNVNAEEVTEAADASLNVIPPAPHSVITIAGDSDFTLANGVSAGTGTPGNPFIIEKWDINGTGLEYGLLVEHTQKHFIIRDSNFFASSGSLDPFLNSGIHLNNATNVTLTNVTCSSNGKYGVSLNNTFNITITDSKIVNNKMDGILVYESSNVTIPARTVRLTHVPD
jgi:parallel beta-helix repeat protein